MAYGGWNRSETQGRPLQQGQVATTRPMVGGGGVTPEMLDAALDGVEPAEGDGIRVVGNVVNLDITALTLAP